MEIISLEHIEYAYGKNKILKDINLKINSGDYITITGKNGVGKSTLLNIIACMLKPSCGKIFYKNEPFDFNLLKNRENFRREKVGIISQDFSLLYDMNVEENISLSLKPLNIPQKIIRDEVKNIMQELNILHLSPKYPSNLSGGECQKVAIARALVKRPEIILADEPTASLDFDSEGEILEILQKLASKGIALVVVTHEEKIIKNSQKVYRMYDGILSLL